MLNINEVGMETGMENTYLVALQTLTGNDIKLAGRKAARQGELIKAGFPVPPGFVLTTQALESFLSSDKLTNPSEIGEALRSAPLPPPIQEAIRQALANLGEGPLAVRSSGVWEDLEGASYAGQYDTVLGVNGFSEVEKAVRHCWASAFHERTLTYQNHVIKAQEAAEVAVLIQRLVEAEASGVIFTANPLTGNRDEIVIEAVFGLGDKLVSGQADPAEWIVRDGEVIFQRGQAQPLSEEQVQALAEIARRVEAHFGQPQDIEWAISGSQIFLLQARPVSVLPQAIEWETSLPGGWARNFRLGEWISGPVTPLFESWLLNRLEDQFAFRSKKFGLPLSPPYHTLINGWYFYSMNFFPQSRAEMLKVLLRHYLPAFIKHPIRSFVGIAMLITPRFGMRPYVQDWQEKWWPRYQAIVNRGEMQLHQMSPVELMTLIDEVGQAAGDYLWSMILAGGFAWKAESFLAAFYQQHLAAKLGGSHQPLLLGLSRVAPTQQPYDVLTLDWQQPTLGEFGLDTVDSNDLEERSKELELRRQEAERQCRQVLEGEPKLARKFNQILAIAQRYVPIREEQFSKFTYGWPLMRQAVLRLGEELCQKELLVAREEVFFLTYSELKAGFSTPILNNKLTDQIEKRRQEWEAQGRLNPPLVLGTFNPIVAKSLSKQKYFENSSRASNATVKGLPASPGRATGRVRVIHTHQEFEQLQPGEVLVAPLTTPAWTLLFNRAVAVVTNIGSPLAHASLVAREYGLPAVVATGDATARLNTGQLVTVDGNTGVVEILV